MVIHEIPLPPFEAYHGVSSNVNAPASSGADGSSVALTVVVCLVLVGTGILVGRYLSKNQPQIFRKRTEVQEV